MIEEKEIRLGNWFHHNEEWSNQSEGRGAHDFQFESCHWYWMGEGCFSLDNIEPILITEELLLKFGFEKTISSDFSKEIHNGWNIVWQSCNYVYLKYLELECEISHFEYKHVHEVQNLYYALTGEELEVK